MGYFIPGSMSSEYVSSKRNESGSQYYESQAAEVGLQKQAAFQQLNETYSQAIDNAYSSYLAANRGINTSNMGQGYKELYKEAQEQQLMSNITSSAEYLAEQRASLTQQAASAEAQIQKAYSTEVGYYDKLQQTFANYYEYVQGLTSETSGQSYLDEYEKKAGIDNMYELLANAQLQDYKDEEGKSALNFSDYVRQQTKDIQDDWYQWFLTTGYNSFMNAPKSKRQYAKGEAGKFMVLENDINNFIENGVMTEGLEEYLKDEDNAKAVAERLKARYEQLKNMSFADKLKISWEHAVEQQNKWWNSQDRWWNKLFK